MHMLRAKKPRYLKVLENKIKKNIVPQMKKRACCIPPVFIRLKVWKLNHEISQETLGSNIGSTSTSGIFTVPKSTFSSGISSEKNPAGICCKLVKPNRLDSTSPVSPETP